MRTEERAGRAGGTAAAENVSAADRAGHRDLTAAAGGAVLVAVAALVGWAVNGDGSLYAGWPPLIASWDPHVGPGTPAALALAVLAVGVGPRVAVRTRWRGLLALSWAVSAAWILSLALVDGWRSGFALKLTSRHEYLAGVAGFHDIGAALRTFEDHIVMGRPGNWPTHVAGHPPGATLPFVFLDRIGLGGAVWAAVCCVVLAATAAAAALVTLRALAGERIARKAAPFLVLAPGAIWAGVSADAAFAAVAGWSMALLAMSATRTTRFPVTAAAGSGLLFGLVCYLSYGLPLTGLLLATVLVLARTVRPLPAFAAGSLVVPALFTLAGFHWWDAYPLLVERYHQGVGGKRPYAYWVWANLAAVTVSAGLATVAGLRRSAVAAPGAVRALRTGRPLAGAQRLAVLTLAAALAVVVADLSGMSKAETERIWLPFVLWLLPAAAALPDRRRRGWLGAQVVLALLVNHLLRTSW
ncbi:hypothetical protein [Streptomyces sp. NPDC008125]|uniref:hypothetical protein n=1 Tax=Streptomyces sp. NPDC008125 TaxID=3364811 RepID=UPI0036ECDFCB